MTSSSKHIVVLDGHTANPGDLSWAPFEALGRLTVHPRSAPNEVLDRALDAEILLTNKSLVPAAVIEQLPNLECIGVLATGTNIVDIAAAASRGIPVCNVPAYSTDSVAQLVFAHLLNHCHHVAAHAASVRSGEWQACPDFAYWQHPLIELKGLTLGIIGLGAIGQRVATIGEAFGMRVLGRSRSKPENSLETILRESDVVSLHCPLTDETHHLINAETLQWMKPSAYLINTGRGPLIDEAALAAALTAGQIAGAGLDVLSTEPPVDSPLIQAPNASITPHHAWATFAARQRLLDIMADNLKSFLTGRPQNLVSPTI